MNQIHTFQAGEHCEIVHDTLVSFFQTIDENASTENLVLSFLKWMDIHNLTLTGRRIVIEINETSRITNDEVNAFHNTFKNAPTELLTIVSPPEMNIRFEPACEHLKRYFGEKKEST